MARTKKATKVPKYDMDESEILAARAEKMEGRNFEDLIKQVDREYQMAYDHMKPKWDKWEVRLSLYNNQRRNEEAVGDPLIFTIHQSVLASLYVDQLSSEFSAREPGDEDTAANLNPLAEFDYDEMDKDIIDYSWDWDASFFGVGYCLLMEFSREFNTPLPQIIDPMVAMPDPFAKSIQGIGKRNMGAAQFFGWEDSATIRQLRDTGVYFNLTGLKADVSSESNRSPFDRNHEARNEAHGMGSVQNKSYNLLGDNRRHRVLNWFTWYRGRLCFVTLAEDRSKVIRFEQLPKSVKNIPIIERTLFPLSHELHGVSIPDLTEDKQRARATLQNLVLKSAKLSVLPRYLYNSNKIKNKRDLDSEFNKHVAIDGSPDGTIVPVQNAVIGREVSYIMEILDTAAQRATATPGAKQGIQTGGGTGTLGELQMINSGSDTRYSLGARIFGWSERRFWQQWYQLYKEYFSDAVDEKIIRINGAAGYTFRTLTRDQVVANVDPDIKVSSKVVADAERQQELMTFRAFVADIMRDPNANLRFALKELGRLSAIRRDRVDMLLPQTASEMQAEDENSRLSKGEKVKVLSTDDDMVHIIMHEKAAETPAKKAHINAHKRALLLKRAKPEMFDTPVGVSPELNPAPGGELPGMDNPDMPVPVRGDARTRTAAPSLPPGE